MTSRRIWLTGDPAADDLLTTDDNALLLGMVLDQQVAMEKAFAGPAVIAERMGGRLDVAAIAAMEEDAFVALCSERPAVHRFPGAMAKRVRQVCRVLVDDFEGDAERYRELLAQWLRDSREGDLLMAHVATQVVPGDEIAQPRVVEFEVFSHEGFDALVREAGVRVARMSEIVQG